jgi:hypothetical protein
VLALYQQYKREGRLPALPLDPILRRLGIAVEGARKPAWTWPGPSWQGGFDFLEAMLNDLEKLA